MNMINTISAVDAWNNVVKAIGGKRIKSLTWSCSLDDDSDRIPETFNNVVLLKNSNVIFCTYRLRDRHIIFESDIDSIENLVFKEIEPKKYSMNLFNGLYWEIMIVLA